jgi:hypothetical protein
MEAKTQAAVQAVDLAKEVIDKLGDRWPSYVELMYWESIIGLGVGAAIFLVATLAAIFVWRFSQSKVPSIPNTASKDEPSTSYDGGYSLPSNDRTGFKIATIIVGLMVFVGVGFSVYENLAGALAPEGMAVKQIINKLSD